jgi:hypothetical protein
MLTHITYWKYYRISELRRSIGLGHQNTGNLLWNLYLLSSKAFL